MAKLTTTTPAKANPNTPIIPKATDARAELFYLLGVIKGSGVDGANRIAELVIDLTTPAAPAPTENE